MESILISMLLLLPTIFNLIASHLSFDFAYIVAFPTPTALQLYYLLIFKIFSIELSYVTLYVLLNSL